MIKCENACPRGKFDGCCHKCPDFHTCPDSCQEDPNTCGSSTFDEEAGLQAFQQSQLATLNAKVDTDLTAYESDLESNRRAFQDIQAEAAAITQVLQGKRADRQKIAHSVREIGKIISNQL